MQLKTYSLRSLSFSAFGFTLFLGNYSSRKFHVQRIFNSEPAIKYIAGNMTPGRHVEMAYGENLLKKIRPV